MNINSIYGNSTTQNQIGETNIGIEIDKNTPISPIEKNSTNSEQKPFEVTLQTLESNPNTYEDEKVIPQKKSKEETEEDKWKSNSERMTEEDYKDLVEEGINLEQYTIEQLERALMRIKSQRLLKAESLEQQKQKIDEQSLAIKSMVNRPGISRKVIEKLIETDLPVTDENIERILKAMDMAVAGLDISDKDANYLIKNHLEPTIENLYKAKYSGSYYRYQQVSPETWNSLLPQITEIISSAGMEVNQDTLDSAKWLVDHKLPVTVETLWSYQDLSLIKRDVKEEDILQSIIDTFANGDPPESANLSIVNEERVKAFHQLVDTISDKAIDSIINSGKEITSINYLDLKEAQKQVQEEKQQNSISSIDIKSITVRRQLEEIRLKLTLESGQKLIKNGIRLETDSLSKIVEGLKEIEDQYYRNLLKENNVTVNEANVELLKETITGIDQLKTMPSYILGSTFTNRFKETADGLLKAGIECKQALDKANEAYETLMTKPRSDMGDSITKAFRNVDAILEDLNLEATTANQRAVRILGYNQIPITEENILQIKAYDQQVNQMMNNLHPAVTAHLIKEGIDPLHTPIEELNLQIEQVKEELGITGTSAEAEKYSKYLWKLEKEQKITEEEKKSFIGIYRLLHSVDKTHGAAVGAVIKAGQEITLSNLLTAVRTMKKGKLEAAIDDNFGVLENITYKQENITDQIRAGYYKNVINDIKNHMEPSKLAEIGDPNDIMNMSLDLLQDHLSSTQTDELDGRKEQEYWSEKVKDYRELIEHSEEAIQFINDNHMPVTLQNIQGAADLLSGDQTLFRQWKKFLHQIDSDQKAPSLIDNGDHGTLEQEGAMDMDTISRTLINGLDNPNAMIQQYSIIEKNVESIINQFYENPHITTKDIKTLQRISNGMAFLNKLATKECYEIPLAVGDQITNVNVTIIKNTEETGKVDIRVTSDQLGKITASFSIKKDGLNGFITCDSRNGLDTFKTYEERIKQAIEDVGIEVKQIHICMESKYKNIQNLKSSNLFLQGTPSSQYKGSKTGMPDPSEVREEQDVKTSTEILYKAAKTLLIQIRNMEMKN